jgi:hypothetical protein
MEWVQNLLSKIGHNIVLVGAVCSGITILYLSHRQILPDLDKAPGIVWMLTIFAAWLLVVTAGNSGIAHIRSRAIQKHALAQQAKRLDAEREEHVKRLLLLDPEETMTLGYLKHHDMRRFRAPYTDNTLELLFSMRILQRDEVLGDEILYSIPQHIWDNIKPTPEQAAVLDKMTMTPWERRRSGRRI